MGATWKGRAAGAAALLDGVNAASLALMAVVTWRLARVALVDPMTVVVCGTTALWLWRTRLNPAGFVLAGAAMGLIAGR